MPLSKEKNREHAREGMRAIRVRRMLQPKFPMLQPKVATPQWMLQPNRYLAAHIKAYPDGFNPDGSYCQDYDPKLDPSINPLLRAPCHLPNSPDGGYHP